MYSPPPELIVSTLSSEVLDVLRDDIEGSLLLGGEECSNMDEVVFRLKTQFIKIKLLVEIQLPVPMNTLKTVIGLIVSLF